MEINKNITGKEADRLIDEYLASKNGTKPINNVNQNNSSYTEEVKEIAKNGFSAVQMQCFIDKYSNKTKDVLSIYDNTQIDVVDFLTLLKTYIYHKLWGKIRVYMDSLYKEQNKTKLEDSIYYIKLYFKKINFRNDEEVKFIKNLLKL